MHTNRSEQEQEQEWIQMMCLGVGEVLFCDFLSSFPIPFIVVRMSFVHKYKLTEKKKNILEKVLWFRPSPLTSYGTKTNQPLTWEARDQPLTHPPLLTSCVILSNICGSNQPFFLFSQARGPMDFPWNSSPPGELPSFLLAAPPSSQRPQRLNSQNAPSIVSPTSLSL